ncbi:MAG: hypothetical protein JW934_19400 [Anaerolineae bacterium]|nr:hypothetical protein [Anaerolineae bacterium]
MKIDSSKLDQARKALDLANPSAHATRLLNIAAVRGILDTAHADRLGLSANARDAQLQRLVEHRLLSLLEQPNKLRLGRGAPRSVYALTQGGAHLCHDLGLAAAHVYGQTEPPDQRHDLYLVDLALAAQEASLSVELETPIAYDGGRLRPDALVLPDGGPAIPFEIEGLTDWRQRARLVDKVLNWLALANSAPVGPRPAPDANVRVLWIADRPDAIAAADRVWAEAIAAVRAEYGRPLPVQFWGQPIGDFLSRPDWSSLDGFHRLDNPALAPDFGLLAAQPAAPDAPEDPIAALIPAEALADPAIDARTRLRLRAHARVFDRYLRRAPRRFSPTFFDVARDLYASAYPEQNDADLLAVPWTALLTLRAWIHGNPELAQAVKAAYREYHRARFSGIQMSQQKATDLVYAFLRYHGLRLDSPLLCVWVARPGEVSQRSGFTVQCTARVDIERPLASQHPALLPPDGPGDPLTGDPVSSGAPPSGALFSTAVSPAQLDPDLIHLTARALQWVLQQLLDQAGILDIAPTPKPGSAQS